MFTAQEFTCRDSGHWTIIDKGLLTVYQNKADAQLTADGFNKRLSTPTYDHYAPPPKGIADDVDLVWAYEYLGCSLVTVKKAKIIRARWGAAFHEHWLFPRESEVENG